MLFSMKGKKGSMAGELRLRAIRLLLEQNSGMAPREIKVGNIVTPAYMQGVVALHAKPHKSIKIMFNIQLFVYHIIHV